MVHAGILTPLNQPSLHSSNCIFETVVRVRLRETRRRVKIRTLSSLMRFFLFAERVLYGSVLNSHFTRKKKTHLKIGTRIFRLRK